jgi:hypothetical protein
MKAVDDSHNPKPQQSNLRAVGSHYISRVNQKCDMGGSMSSQGGLHNHREALDPVYQPYQGTGGSAIQMLLDDHREPLVCFRRNIRRRNKACDPGLEGRGRWEKR